MEDQQVLGRKAIINKKVPSNNKQLQSTVLKTYADPHLGYSYFLTVFFKFIFSKVYKTNYFSMPDFRELFP